MFLSYVEAVPLSGMVQGGQYHLPPLCSPMVYTRAAGQGRCHSHECVLTKFKLTLGRETQRGPA